MNKQSIVLAILLSMSFMVNAEAIYSCIKDGKKTISDRPCQSYGADEQNRTVYVSDFDPAKVGLNRPAGTQSGGQDRGGSCRDDVRQFCANARGEKPITDCLLNHQQDISDSCYSTLKQRLQNQQGIQACKNDSEQLCKGVQPGGERIVNCLLDHQKDVSDACYDALAKRIKSKGAT